MFQRTDGTRPLQDPNFWLALVLAPTLQACGFGVICGISWLETPAHSPAVAIVAYGDSSVAGFAVDLVQLDPGTWKQGIENTPGGDQSLEPLAEREIRPLAAERANEPVPFAITPEDKPPVPPEPLPAAPAPREEPVTRTPAPAAESKSPSERANGKDTAPTTRAGALPGAPGGARLPVGTPSAGGTVGSSNGVRQIGAAKPAYPREALLRGIEGRVVLLLEVSADGSVMDAKVEKSSGHAILDNAALVFARTLRFIPARENYQPVAVTARCPVTFSLADAR